MATVSAMGLDVHNEYARRVGGTQARAASEPVSGVKIEKAPVQMPPSETAEFARLTQRGAARTVAQFTAPPLSAIRDVWHTMVPRLATGAPDLWSKAVEELKANKQRPEKKDYEAMKRKFLTLRTVERELELFWSNYRSMIAI